MMSTSRLRTNFSAGPAALPTAVIQRFTREFDNYRGSGYSIAECSHRSALYKELHLDTIAKIRRVLSVPSDYQILLLGGGATLQFALVAYNFGQSHANNHRDAGSYCISGSWGKQAFQSAERVAPPHIAYDGQAHGYTRLPEWDELSYQESSYLHCTSNETINGLQFKQWPAPTATMPALVVDMSSDIMTKPLPVSRFSLIYASAQKNIGVAGVTVVIVQTSFLERAIDTLPPYLSYQTHASAQSLYNTPPTVSIYSINLVMDWIIEQGGLLGINARNLEKAGLLYAYLDEHSDFYCNRIPVSDRSMVNVVFSLPTAELTERFLSAAAAHQIVGINGHRSVGGCRVSLYNGIELRGVELLIDFMDSFRRQQPTSR